MTRKRRLLLAIAGIIVVPIVAFALYLSFSDFSGWRDRVARIASNALDRELTISGEFEADLGIVTRIHATELSLANTEWGSESKMASIGRLDAEIDLRSLFSGAIDLPRVSIEGGRAVFESTEEGGSNWALGSGDGSGDGAPISLRIDRIDLTDLEIVAHGQNGAAGIEAAIASMESTGDADGMHRLSLTGRLQGTDVEVGGRLGPLDGLVNLAAIDHDLDIRLGTTEIRSAGTIADLGSLTGFDIEATASIPKPDEITGLFGLPATGAGPGSVEVSATNTTALTSFTITVNATAITARAGGTVDSLTAPSDLEIEIEAAGTDIRHLGAVAGIVGLPEHPYDVKGKLRWQGFPIEVSGLEVRVGDTGVAPDGALGAPPTMLGTDFRFSGGGPDIAALAALAGARLPADRFELEGRLVRVEHGLHVDAVKASVGRARLSASGHLGDFPEYTDTDLVFAASGPNLAHFRDLAGVDLPSEAFDVKGRLADGGDAIALSGVRARIGSNAVNLDGHVTTEPRMIGTALDLIADVPDLSGLGPTLGIEGLPMAPLHIEGGVVFENGGYRLQKLTGRLADLTFAVDGNVTRRKGLIGSVLRLDVDGADLSILGPFVGDIPLAVAPFRVAGGLEMLDRGYRLRGVEIELGSARAGVDGLITAIPGLEGTELSIEARGPDLSVASGFVPDLDLPSVGFSAKGRAAFGEGTITLDGAIVEIAEHRLVVDGLVVPPANLTGSELEFTLEGAELASAGRMIAQTLGLEVPELPELGYTVSGKLAADESGYRLEPLIGNLGRAEARFEGRLGPRPDFAGTDLVVHVDGPDASLFQKVTGTEIPVAPFQMNGRVALTNTGFGFDSVRFRLGEFRALVDGTVGSPPKLIGTDLKLQVEGPDLTLIGDLAGHHGLPALPFRLAGRFEGNPQRFTADDLEARIGSSDISGGFRVDLEAKPAATCSFRSDRISLPELRQLMDDDGAEVTADDSAPPPAQGGRLISDTPIDLSGLETFDLELDWNVDELILQLNRYREVGITAHLDAGRLEVDRFEGVGSAGGALQSRAVLEPVAEGYRLQSTFTLADARVNLAGETADLDQYAPLDLHVDFSAVGRTPHEMAASSNGRVSVIAAGGVVGSSIVDLVAADVLITLLDALNPFAKEEQQTHLQCAVLVANFENGVMTLDPAAIQTDKMTILGSGTIDFGTEKLKLDWVTKPRKGIGLSASTITNPYIRLGGTLADPAIEMKPVEALATTGFAVATAGLSILGKGLLDRITAEKKVCEQAIKKAEKQLQPEQPKKKRKRK